MACHTLKVPLYAKPARIVWATASFATLRLSIDVMHARRKCVITAPQLITLMTTQMTGVSVTNATTTDNVRVVRTLHAT